MYSVLVNVTFRRPGVWQCFVRKLSTPGTVNTGANRNNKNKKRAGAELCQAQDKLGLAKIKIFFDLIEN